MFVKFSLLFAAMFGVAFSLTTQERVNITKTNIGVYYEALCGDSAKFVTTQLMPLLLSAQNGSIAHYLNVTFVPFGKSSVVNKTEDGMYNFECHHGPEECMGNKYQACAISKMEDKMQLYKYINCTMAQGIMMKETNYSIGKKCAEEVKYDAATLEDCVNMQGSELMVMNGNKTAMIQSPLKSVPSIVFNDTFNQEKQTEAMKNFKGLLCKEIPDSTKLVAECASGKNSATSVMATSLLMLVTTTLVTKLY